MKLTELSPYLKKHKKELAIEFEVAQSTVIRWANGVTAPLDCLNKMIVDYINKKNDLEYDSYGSVAQAYATAVKKHYEACTSFIQAQDEVFDYGLDGHVEEMLEAEQRAEKLRTEKDDLFKEMNYLESRYLRKSEYLT